VKTGQARGSLQGMKRGERQVEKILYKSGGAIPEDGGARGGNEHWVSAFKCEEGEKRSPKATEAWK